MPRPVANITAPWSTPEEMENRFPIPEDRKEEFQELVDEFKALLSNREEAPMTSIKTEKGGKCASAA